MFKWLKNLRTKSGNMTFAQYLKLGLAQWTKKDYRSLSVEGYQKNIIAYWCISKISKAVADIPFIVKINDKEVENNPVIQLLKRPNPVDKTYVAFMRKAITHHLISGNIYVHGLQVSTKKIMELTLLRPDRVTIDVNQYDEPYRYTHITNGHAEYFSIEPLTMDSEILHIKEINPLCDIYGMSPITAASMGIDQHNSSSEWNKRLLDNSARPPGVLAMKDRGDNSVSMTPEKLIEISNMLNERFAGYKNAGKIPVTSFDMEWRAMGFNPTDMDWIQGKMSTAREICLAFGVPPVLLGFPEGSTFNNVAEAKLALYEETVVPLAQSTLGELAYFLSSKTGQQIHIEPDLDRVSALQPRRQTARENARQDVNAGIITINEARQEIGYDEVEGGDEVLVPAGKLPLNFDLSSVNMSQEKYIAYLKTEGFSEEHAVKLAKLAYESGN